MRTYVRMHPPALRQRVSTLATLGLTDGEVAARLGLPRSTVREWRTQAWPEGLLCTRRWRRTKPIVIEPESYAELVYETYEFRNQSRDLLDLLSQTCDRVGVDHRRTPERIRISRRDAVAAMLAHVGRKG
jgi:transposase-like protein